MALKPDAHTPERWLIAHPDVDETKLGDTYDRVIRNTNTPPNQAFVIDPDTYRVKTPGSDWQTARELWPKTT